jgi:hypothetical protein
MHYLCPTTCKILCFCHGWVEVFALLGSYVADMGNLLHFGHLTVISLRVTVFKNNAGTGGCMNVEGQLYWWLAGRKGYRGHSCSSKNIYSVNMQHGKRQQVEDWPPRVTHRSANIKQRSYREAKTVIWGAYQLLLCKIPEERRRCLILTYLLYVSGWNTEMNAA